MFGFKLAALIGTWDVDGLLAAIPAGLLSEWQAFYALRPWDAAATWAMIEGRFGRPDWLEDIVEQTAKRNRSGKKPMLSGRAIMRRMKHQETMLNWTWP